MEVIDRQVALHELELAGIPFQELTERRLDPLAERALEGASANPRTGAASIGTFTRMIAGGWSRSTTLGL
jgi:hypothetical protein